MKLLALCCEVFHREICALSAQSTHTIDLQFLPKGLHDLGSEKMRARLQEVIDGVDVRRYEAIVMGYGLCSNGVRGLRSRSLPLILPRAHDCITLFLGSRGRYREYFDSHPGVYFETSGWLERGKVDADLQGETIQAQMGMDQGYQELVEKHGEENARFIWETLHAHETRYGQITFIEMGIAPDDFFEQQAREKAAKRGWNFEKMQGDIRLIERLLNGPWDSEDFLYVPPGHEIILTHDDQIVTTKMIP